MKKFKAITIAIFISITSFAQHDHSSHKNQLHNTTNDTTRNSYLSELLTSYYGIKDALVADNSSQGSVNAERFIKNLNAVDYKVISEGNANALLKDATLISINNDIKKQREHFVNLSNNMVTLAKAVRFSAQPIYEVYCPMQEANWLSNSKEIKNPYYGSAMLTCGKIVATIE